MGEQSEETRLAVVETQYKFIADTLAELKGEFVELGKDIRRYNGVRERLDEVERKQNAHDDNHWKTTMLVVSASGILSGIIFGIIKIVGK